MRKLLLIFSVACMSSSCSKDDLIHNTSGTQLMAIEHSDQNQTWAETFMYNDKRNLKAIEEQIPYGKRYEISYNNDNVTTINSYLKNDNSLVSKDSIAYSENNVIQSVYHFYPPTPGENVEIYSISEFTYNTNNQIIEKRTYSLGNNTNISIEKYFWNVANIERATYYNGEGTIRYEVFYSHDKKINYKNGIPIYIVDPTYWNQNNVINSSINDYTHAISYACNPCQTKYTYNKDRYPLTIEFEWGSKLKLIYE